MALVTKDNLVPLLSVIISAQGAYMLRDIFKYFRIWRNGISDRQDKAMGYVAAQLERCTEDLEATEDERDLYRQQVGERDYIILKHGLELPKDRREKP